MNDNDLAQVGEKIREARKARRLTLQRIATATDLSIGFLSQVERNIATPSLSSLVLIAKALDLPISSFLRQPDIPSAISRGEGRPSVLSSDSRIEYERLSTTFPGQMLNAVKVRVPPRYLSTASSHDGEEIAFVIAGVVRYIIDGTIYELHVGDSLHFSANRAHQLQNPTDVVAEFLAVGTKLHLSELDETRRARSVDRPLSAPLRNEPPLMR